MNEEEKTLPSRSPLPDIADIIFLFIVILLTNVVPNFVLGDGSTGWHLATGEWILKNGAIPSTDLFSSVYPDRPWVPYEWLSDVIGAGLAAIGGLKLVAIATCCAIAWLFSLVYLECRRNGCHFGLATILTILASLTSSIHWLARPHIFTFFGVFLMARHLEKYRTGEESRKRLWVTIAVMMALWSNLHPAFLVGFALIIIYLASEVGIYFFLSKDLQAASAHRLKTFAAGLGIAVAATFLNPNATRMYTYIFNYLKQSFVLQNTQEYMAGNLHDLHAACMLLIMLAFAAGLAGSRKSIGVAPLLTVLAFGYLGLTSMRNEPLFAVIATPIVGGLFSNWSLRKVIGKPYKKAQWLERLLVKMQPTNENMDTIERTCTMHLLPAGLTALLCVACLFGGKFGPLELVVADWDPLTKPTKTLKCIEELGLDYRHGLNYDNWGGYLFYKTGKRVFIDDRLDFYGTDYFLDYASMIYLGPKSKATMDKHGIEWVLFPINTPLVKALRASPDWQELCADKASVVFARKKTQ